jgi:hypothetical protein
MSRSSTLWVVPAFLALGGCVIGGESARHDMAASKAARRVCLAAQEPEICEAQRQGYEADLSAYRATPKIVIGGGTTASLVAGPASGGMSAGMGGETVYIPHECIGAVVNGQCYGSILPDYNLPHPTCYDQLINGICTGPMF